MPPYLGLPSRGKRPVQVKYALGNKVENAVLLHYQQVILFITTDKASIASCVLLAVPDRRERPQVPHTLRLTPHAASERSHRRGREVQHAGYLCRCGPLHESCQEFDLQHASKAGPAGSSLFQLGLIGCVTVRRCGQLEHDCIAQGQGRACRSLGGFLRWVRWTTRELQRLMFTVQRLIEHPPQAYIACV